MKKKLNIGILLSLLLFLHACQSAPDTTTLKVMSFNIWVGGGKSKAATAKVIVDTGADIIGFQESSTGDGYNITKQMADSLGYHAYIVNSDRSIISRYPIVDTSRYEYGVKVKIDDKKFAWIFNAHLYYYPYEPYQLNNIPYDGAPFLQTAEQAVASANATREKEVSQMIEDINIARKDNYPIFLVGDFNEPSCLDWTEKAVAAGHCKLPVAWPSTKAFMEKAGMVDSYRKLYPDEVSHPGYTWTPLPSERDVLDRIDFVFYSDTTQVKVKDVQVVGEESNQSQIKFKEYPSDHRAVMGTFMITYDKTK